jgi:transposase
LVYEISDVSFDLVARQAIARLGVWEAKIAGFAGLGFEGVVAETTGRPAYAADAEAIAEAASRPTMRFVAVKTQEQQARAMLFRTRDLLVRQRTQLINALRGQLSEHGVVAPQGPANVAILAQAIDDVTSLPLLVVELARVYLDQIDGLSQKVAGLEKR